MSPLHKSDLIIAQMTRSEMNAELESLMKSMSI